MRPRQRRGQRRALVCTVHPGITSQRCNCHHHGTKHGLTLYVFETRSHSRQDRPVFSPPLSRFKVQGTVITWITYGESATIVDVR